MKPTIARDRFVSLAADYSVIPVAVEVLGDRETPVTIFEKLVGDGPGFLLESVEGGERWARWSFVGWAPEFAVVSRRGETAFVGREDAAPSGDPLSVLEALLDAQRVPDPEDVGLGPDAPPLHTGAVGYLAYDIVRYIEDLPDRPPDDRDLPEMVWHFTGSVAAVDRFRDTVLLIRNVYVGNDPGADYDAAIVDLESAVAKLGRPTRYVARSRPAFVDRPETEVNLTRREFEATVVKAIQHVEAGDAFQIVPSLRYRVDYAGDAFAVYRALRLVNPSPFMFFFRHDEVSIAGSSPELMVRVRDRIAFSRPIAGTRPRGGTIEEDLRLEQELLEDPKERAEHVMLVDLARNDLGRVAEYGTVSVDELMVIERYSHVMHIVSGISARLRDGAGPVDVVRATFPHGTVTGAPKVRAMEIIDELEPVARGPYAGAVGYVDFSGNLDTAIALRTMVAAADSAWVQAGAGVVADSDPAKEYEECVRKAAAVLAAIEAARSV